MRNMKAYCSFYDMDQIPVKSNIKQKRILKQVIAQLVFSYTNKQSHFSYIFTSDDFLLQMNQQYLNHNTYTDIISFDLSEKNNTTLQGEFYISTERVKDNASKLNISYEQEILRVILHGALHLCGFKDKTKNDIAAMRDAEDTWMALYKKELSKK